MNTMRYPTPLGLLRALFVVLLLAGPAVAQPAPEAPADPVPPADSVAPPTDADEAPPASALQPEPAPAPPATSVSQPEAAPTAAEPSEAEISELIAGATAEPILSDGPSLSLYGFADFTLRYARFTNNKGLETGADPKPSFFVGNLNLYADGDLTGGWRSLFEIRFMYLPNGSAPYTGGERFSTAARDYTEADRPVSWGGIEIERAWLQYTAHGLLTIRAGQWLTPYGIWNVDHGSPAIISIYRPFVIGEALFPERQTGLEAFGSHTFDEVTLGYHVTLSNGRGQVDAYQDLDANKAIGGRIFVTLTSVGTLTIGTSIYAGRSTNSYDVPRIGPDGVFFDEVVTSQYDELAYAADVLWQWEAFHFQAELIGQDVAYTDRGRPPPLPQAVAAPPGLTPDYRYLGGYVLLGYRLPWLTLMPYLQVGYLDTGRDAAPGSGGSFTMGTIQDWGAGVNVRPIPAVTLKLDYHRGNIDGPTEVLVAKTDELTAQVAWSF